MSDAMLVYGNVTASTRVLTSRAPSDDVIVLDNVTWADYQRLLQIRGERPVPRLTYLEGVLELMTPSRAHASIKSMIGRLVETWCLENGVAITAYGSWTLEDKEAERGVEPDECSVLGDVEDPARCDLAIEVFWSHGRIDKLDVYRKLGVREVWLWRTGTIRVFLLRDVEYVPIDRSELLPVSIIPVSAFHRRLAMARAVSDYRSALRANE